MTLAETIKMGMEAKSYPQFLYKYKQLCANSNK